jgi:hypothetical protein
VSSQERAVDHAVNSETPAAHEVLHPPRAATIRSFTSQQEAAGQGPDRVLTPHRPRRGSRVRVETEPGDDRRRRTSSCIAGTRTVIGCSRRPRAAKRQIDPKEASSSGSFRNHLRLPPQDSMLTVRPPSVTVKVSELVSTMRVTPLTRSFVSVGEPDRRRALGVPGSPRALTRRTLGRRRTRVGSRHERRSRHGVIRPSDLTWPSAAGRHRDHMGRCGSVLESPILAPTGRSASKRARGMRAAPLSTVRVLWRRGRKDRNW